MTYTTLIGYGIFVLVVTFGDKLLPLAYGGLLNAYEGTKAFFGGSGTTTTTKTEAALPSFSETMDAMALIKTYKLKCKDAPEYEMALAALKTLEAS